MWSVLIRWGPWLRCCVGIMACCHALLISHSYGLLRAVQLRINNKSNRIDRIDATMQEAMRVPFVVGVVCGGNFGAAFLLWTVWEFKKSSYPRFYVLRGFEPGRLVWNEGGSMALHRGGSCAWGRHSVATVRQLPPVGLPADHRWHSTGALWGQSFDFSREVGERKFVYMEHY